MEDFRTKETVISVSDVLKTEEDGGFRGCRDEVAEMALKLGNVESKLTLADVKHEICNGSLYQSETFHSTECIGDRPGGRTVKESATQQLPCFETGNNESKSRDSISEIAKQNIESDALISNFPKATNKGCDQDRNKVRGKTKSCRDSWLWKTYSCTHCNQYFMNLQHLQIHRRIHQGWKIFECSKCSKPFITLFSLRKHQLFRCVGDKKRDEKLVSNVSDLQKGYWCKNCGKKLPNGKFYKVHLSSCSLSVPYICTHCGKGFSSDQKASLHQNLHKSSTFLKYQSRSCAHRFTSFYSMKNHIARHAGSTKTCSGYDESSKANTPAGPDKFSHQTYCSMQPIKVGRGDKEEKSHTNLVHPNNLMKCKLCPETFQELRHLVLHQQVHVSSHVKFFPCGYCGKMFSGAHHLKTHMVVHTGEKPYSCDECGKQFAYKNCMRRHQATCSGSWANKKPAELNKPISFKLEAQVKQEQDIKHFACEFCDKKFEFKEQLKNHESFHFGALSKNPDFDECKLDNSSNNRGCDQQGLSSSSEETQLISQMVIHSVEDQSTSGVHLCKPCGKYFSCLSKLKEHSVIHTGEKPFQCKFCGRLFSFLSGMKRHEKIHIRKQMNGEEIPKTSNKSNRDTVSRPAETNTGIRITAPKIDQFQFQFYQTVQSSVQPESNPSLTKDVQRLKAASKSLQESEFNKKDVVPAVDTPKTNFSPISFGSTDESNSLNQVTTKPKRSQTATKRHMCGVCGAWFSWGSGLAIHLAHAHNSKRFSTFSCSVCKKSLKFKKYLLAHMISHNKRMLKCDFCKIAFHQTSALKKHLFDQHAAQISHLSKLPIKAFKCVCGEEFKRTKDLLAHEKLHKKQKLLVCKYCHQVFLCLALFQDHLLSHNGASRRKQPSDNSNLCLKSFHGTEYTLTHKNNHTGQMLYLCQLCNRQFPSKHNLHLHVSLRHSRSSKKIRLNSPKLCVKCGQFCKTGKSYSAHMKRHKRESQSLNEESSGTHAKALSNTRTIADKKDNSAHAGLYSPAKKHVLSLLPVTPEKNTTPKKQIENQPRVRAKRTHKFKKKAGGMLSLWSSREVSDKHSCVVCLETFKSTWALQNHMTVHLRLKPTRCDSCDKIFAHVADLIEHKLQHCEMSPTHSQEHKNAPKRKPKLFFCDICESRFPARSHLVAHMVVHTGAKPYSCEMCGRRFSFLSCLKRHLTVHLRGEKSINVKSSLPSSNKKKAPGAELEFYCSDCGRRFSRFDSLHDHVCQHIGILPYKCPDCNNQFVDFAELKQHKRNCPKITRKSRDYVCEVCGKAFLRLQHVKEHVKIHDSKTWVCEICCSSFSSLRKLNKHHMIKCKAMLKSENCTKPKLETPDDLGTKDLEVFTGVPCKLNLQNYECVDCHKVFSRYRHLKKHRQTCMRETTFSCATCGEKFTEIKTLEKHIDDFHNLTNKMNAHIITSRKRVRRSRGFNPTGKKHFRCDVCGKEFVSALYLSNHSALHTGDMPVICECCGASFTHMNALQKHQTQTSCGASGGHFTCKFCDEKFASLGELRIHNSTKMGPRFPCSKCSEKFSSCFRLQRHQALCKLGKAVIPNICEVCGKRFSNTSNMKEHMITHTGEKPFACGQCGRRFGHMAALRRHLSVHGGDLPFKCKVCDKGFTIASALKKHEEAHMDLKSRQVFKCEECGKGFVTRQRLKRHAYLHKDEKPLKCQFCGKGFINPFHMKNHLIQHHGMPSEEHRCKFCGLVFSSRFQLTQHQDLHCTRLAETISQLLPPDGESDSTILRNLRDDDSIVISPMPVLEEPVTEEEYIATQTTEIIIQENDGNGNITEKTIVVTLPENIDLAQWLQNGGEIQTETMDGEAISYITMAESPEQLPLQGDSLTAVQEDMTGVKNGEEEVVCQYCGETCASQEEAQAHLQHQHPFVEYVELPASITETLSVVSQGDITTVQEPVTEETPECPQVSLELEEQRTHMCQHCGKQFIRGHDLNRHVMTCSKTQPADDPVYAAGDVPVQNMGGGCTQSPKALVKKFMCDVCGAQYPRIADLHCHKLNTHGGVNKVEPTENETGQSDSLTMVTVYAEGIIEQKESKKGVHACELCDKVFVRKRSLQQHMIAHNNTKAFKCNQCDKQYAYESSLWSHMKSHEEGGRERHSCFVCGKSYSDKCYLKKHMITHTSGTLPYICNLCSKGFLLPAGLKRHRRDVHKLSL